MADNDLREPLLILQPSGSSRVGVLLSHGFTGSPASMRAWGEHLADAGYSVSVPRLPGHGTVVEDMLPTRYEDYRQALETAYAELAAHCDIVIAGGLSMGGTLVLDLAERHREIGGVMLVNAAVASTDKRLILLPVLKHLVKTFPAISDDIKKPNTTEGGYDKTPLKPLASLVAAWKPVRANLGDISAPLLLMRSMEDHVVDPSSARFIWEGVASTDKTELLLENSYHVATLDNDAPAIFAASTAFIERVTTP